MIEVSKPNATAGRINRSFNIVWSPLLVSWSSAIYQKAFSPLLRRYLGACRNVEGDETLAYENSGHLFMRSCKHKFAVLMAGILGRALGFVNVFSASACACRDGRTSINS